MQALQARGGISLLAISVRACMPGQRIFTSRAGYWYTAFYFDLAGGVSGDQPIRPPSPPTNWVRACPQRTKPAPIYSAQFRPSVRKRTEVARELRDQAPEWSVEFGMLCREPELFDGRTLQWACVKCGSRALYGAIGHNAADCEASDAEIEAWVHHGQAAP